MTALGTIKHSVVGGKLAERLPHPGEIARNASVDLAVAAFEPIDLALSVSLGNEQAFEIAKEAGVGVGVAAGRPLRRPG